MLYFTLVMWSFLGLFLSQGHKLFQLITLAAHQRRLIKTRFKFFLALPTRLTSLCPNFEVGYAVRGWNVLLFHRALSVLFLIYLGAGNRQPRSIYILRRLASDTSPVRLLPHEVLELRRTAVLSLQHWFVDLGELLSVFNFFLYLALLFPRTRTSLIDCRFGPIENARG